MLGFASVESADFIVTDEGHRFVTADILTSKHLFARQASTRAPLVRAITNALESSIDGKLHERFFLDTLHRGFTEGEARRQLETAIDWGRYGELFDYDTNTGELTLEPAVERA
jgi:NitT/TauT family transport system ATP-binding protein